MKMRILIISYLVIMTVWTASIASRTHQFFVEQPPDIELKAQEMQRKLDMIWTQQSLVISEIRKILETEKAKQVTLTAYSPEVSQTDNDPLVTACLTKVRQGTVAVSQDLFYRHGWSCNKRVHIQGHGIFTINDVMHRRKRNQIDVFFWDKQDAIEFGRHEAVRATL